MDKIGIIGYGEIGSGLYKLYEEYNYSIKVIDPLLGMNEDLSKCNLLNICIPFTDKFIGIVNSVCVNICTRTIISYC